MYIISNYLSIIIVIGIIDNLAADYPTQFFLMWQAQWCPQSSSTTAARRPRLSKRQAS